MGTVAIWYSWFRTVAVMLPPSVTAPLKVTKSLTTAPCAVSVTVSVASPLVAANVTSPAAVVDLMGVTSLKLLPSAT